MKYCVAHVAHAAWDDKPSWYVVSTKDHIVPTNFQIKLAKQIGATTLDVDASHVPMLSKPQEVAAAIISAARQAK
jgi:pimeloyl-ACP methyl ester carboxylesterase